MARQTGDEDVRTAKRSTGHAAHDTTAAGSDKHRSTAVESASEERRGERPPPALSELLLRDDGWLRAIPDGTGKTAYLKWKFTRGKFAGTYVMVVVRPWDWQDGFRMLQAKIENCYAGNRKPTPDRSYLPIFDDEELPG
jgi:hypothetical protein